MFDMVKTFLDSGNFKYEIDEESKSLTFWVGGNSGNWMGVARTLEHNNMLIFYSVVPVRVPQENRKAVMEFITMANYNLLMGNFEMDLKDGELRLKTGVDVTGDALTLNLVRNVINFNLVVMEHYLKYILRVMKTGEDPAVVFKDLADYLMNAGG